MDVTIIYPKGQFGSTEDETFKIQVDELPEDSVMALLERVWRIMNVVDGSDFEMPQHLKCRSMCVGDIAIIDDKQYKVAPLGWQMIVDEKLHYITHENINITQLND